MQPDPNTLRNQYAALSAMSDEELGKYMEMMSHMHPQFKNMPPAMLRQSLNMMQGMDNSQIQNAANMARQMQQNMGGTGGMPNMGAMPGTGGMPAQPQVQP